MPITGGNAFQRTIELLVRADPSALQGLTQAFQANQAVFEAYAAATARGAITTAEYTAATQGLAKEQTTLASAIDIGTASVDREYKALVAETEAIMASMVASRQKANATAGVAREQDHLNGLLAEGALQEQNATRATITVVKSKKELGDAAEKAGERSKGLAFAVLATSHALQDLQYGFSAVVNNIPTVVYGIGSAVGASTTAIAAWGGALMGVGVVFQIATPTILEFGKQLNLLSDPSTKFNNNLKDMQDKLKELQAKPWWIHVETSEIEAATRKVADIERRLRAVEGARQSDVEAAASKEAKAAVVEFGGGSEAIQKGLFETDRLSGIDRADPALRDRIKRIQETIAGNLENVHGESLEALQKGLANAIKQANEQSAARGQEEAKNLLGKFLEGDFGAIQTVQRRAAAFPGAFAQAGPGGVTAAEAIANLAPSAVEQRRRLDAEREQQERDDQESINLGLHKKATGWTEKAATAAAKAAKDAEYLSELEDTESEAHAKKYFAAEATAATRGGKKLTKNVAADTKRLQDQAFVGQLGDMGFQDPMAIAGSKQVAGLIRSKGMEANAALEMVAQAMVRQIARQDASMNIFGQAAAIVQRLDAEQAQMKAQMQWMSGQWGRVGNRRQSLLPQFGN